MVKPYYIKDFHSVKKKQQHLSEVLYKAVVLKSFAKLTGKHLYWSHLYQSCRHKDSPIKVFSYEVFFQITRQNQTTLQRKQIGKHNGDSRMSVHQ